MAASHSSIGARNEQNRKQVKKEHESEIRFGLAIGAAKFLPHQHAPESSDHRCRLSDRVGNGDAGKSRGDEIEDSAQAPNAAAQKSEQVACCRPAKEISEMNRLTDKRLLHEINIPEEAGKQCAESEEHANTVWAEGVASRHSARDEGRPESHQDARDDAGDDAFLGDGAVYAGKVAVG